MSRVFVLHVSFVVSSRLVSCRSGFGGGGEERGVSARIETNSWTT